MDLLHWTIAFEAKRPEQANLTLLWHSATAPLRRCPIALSPTDPIAECGSKYFQASGSNVLIEFCDAFGVTAQWCFNRDYSLVSASEPYYFRGMTVMGRHVRKI
jgi:hypothetical protein